SIPPARRTRPRQPDTAPPSASRRLWICTRGCAHSPCTSGCRRAAAPASSPAGIFPRRECVSRRCSRSALSSVSAEISCSPSMSVPTLFFDADGVPRAVPISKFRDRGAKTRRHRTPAVPVSVAVPVHRPRRSLPRPAPPPTPPPLRTPRLQGFRRDQHRAELSRPRPQVAAACQRVQRKIMPVQMIFQIENLGKPRARELCFFPGALAGLRVQQIVARPLRGSVLRPPRGQQADQAPGRLRRGHRPAPLPLWISIGGDGLPKPPVRILHRFQPLHATQRVGL